MIDQRGSLFFEEFDLLLNLLDQRVDLFGLLVEVSGDELLFLEGGKKDIEFS